MKEEMSEDELSSNLRESQTGFDSVVGTKLIREAKEKARVLVHEAKKALGESRVGVQNLSFFLFPKLDSKFFFKRRLWKTKIILLDELRFL